MGGNELLTVREACDYLRVSKPTLYGLMRRGELTSAKVGGLRRISVAALTAFVQSHTQTGPKAEKTA